MSRPTTREALAQGRFYPAFIRLRLEVPDSIAPLALAQDYARWLREAGLGGIYRYSVAGMDGEDVPGSQADLELRISTHEDGPGNPHYFKMTTEDDSELSFVRGLGGRTTWTIEGRYPSETIPTVEWMEAMAKLCIAAASIPGLQRQELERDTAWADFPPQPPLAGCNHVVTVTDAMVAAAYNDPSSLPHSWQGSFYDCWDRVERVGDQRVCIRALDKLDVEQWLAATFETTMHLARLAKPKKTRYLPPGNVRPAFAAWWEYGDLIDEEKAGYPALKFTGYDPTTRTVEYAGFCTDTRVSQGGPDPRHVLIREIHSVRALVKAKKDRDGRPVDTVRIVFMEEWMARRERRPLLDAGARVYFMDRNTGKDVEVTD
jgi:hypothetical protein